MTSQLDVTRMMMRQVGRRTGPELVQMLHDLFNTCRSYRQPLVRRWHIAYRRLVNRQWDPGKRPEWMPTPAVPEMFAVLRALVSWMMDTPYSTVVVPDLPTDHPGREVSERLASDMAKILDSTWVNYGEESELAAMLWDGLVYGTGFLKTVWDSSLSGGLGDATIRRVDPFCVYVDPLAKRLDWANIVFEVRRTTLVDVDRMFPGAAEKLAGKVRGGDVDARPEHVDIAGGTSGIPVGFAIKPIGGGSWSRVADADSILWPENTEVVLCEAWIREHEHEIEEGDESTPEASQVHTAEHWRVVVFCDDVILLDERASDLYGHDVLPYSRWAPIEMGEMWGYGLAELLVPVQETLNRLLAALQHNIELAGNPMLVVPRGAGLEQNIVYNKPGLGLKVNDPAGQLRWLQPPTIHQGFLELLGFYLQRMEAIAGLTAVTRGAMPGGRPPESALENLAESAFVTIRNMLRALEWALGRASQIKASLVAENYVEPRLLSYFGPGGEPGVMELQRRHFYLPTPDNPVPLRFQVRVQAGADTFTNRTLRREEARWAYVTGLIDREEALRALNWPYAKQIADRINAREILGAFNPPGKRERARRTG